MSSVLRSVCRRVDNREIGSRLVLTAVLLALAITAGGAAAGGSVVRNGFLAVSFEPGSEYIWRVDPVTGRATALAKAASPDELAWSPNGHILVFNAGNGSQLTTRAIDERGRNLPLVLPGYALSFSPDGRRVVFQSCLVCFATSRVDGSDVKQLYRCRCAIYEPKWSPRGDRIAYIRQHDRTDGGVTYTIRLRTFAGRDHALLGEGYPCFDQGSAVWSPDARTIAFTCEDDSSVKIYAVGADRGLPRVLIKGGEVPAWSPDGTKLAFSRINKDDTRTLSVLDLRTHRVRALLTRRIIYSIAWRPARS